MLTEEKKPVNIENHIGQTNFTGRFVLTNADKIGFTRRDLALCFYPEQIVAQADRIYESLIIDKYRTHEDNPMLIKLLFARMPKNEVYSGYVKKITKQSFNWENINKKLTRDYPLKKVLVTPIRKSIIETISFTTTLTDYNEHALIIRQIRELIRQNSPLLTFEVYCEENWKGPCRIPKTKSPSTEAV